jgi:hypothetical protein
LALSRVSQPWPQPHQIVISTAPRCDALHSPARNIKHLWPLHNNNKKLLNLLNIENKTTKYYSLQSWLGVNLFQNLPHPRAQPWCKYSRVTSHKIPNAPPFTTNHTTDIHPANSSPSSSSSSSSHSSPSSATTSSSPSKRYPHKPPPSSNPRT